MHKPEIMACDKKNDIGYYGYATSMRTVKFTKFNNKILIPIFLSVLMLNILIIMVICIMSLTADQPKVNPAIFSSALAMPPLIVTIITSKIIETMRLKKTDQKDRTYSMKIFKNISEDIDGSINRDRLYFYFTDEPSLNLRLVTNVYWFDDSVKSEDNSTIMRRLEADKNGQWAVKFSSLSSS